MPRPCCAPTRWPLASTHPSRRAPTGRCSTSSPTRAWSTAGPRATCAASPSSRSRSSARGAGPPTCSAGSTTGRRRCCRRSSTRRTTSTRSSSSRTRLPPRLFWTRRQCHETTVHAVDALGARLGRPARADETWIRPGRRARRHRRAARRLRHPPQGGRLTRRPDPAARAPRRRRRRLARRPRHRPADPDQPGPVGVRWSEGADADHVLTGDPVDLYLRLWSRGAAEPVEPPPSLERWWRETISISW